MIDQKVDKLRVAFGDQPFSGKDVARVLGTDPRGTGGIFKYMRARGIVRQITSGVYQFVNVQKQVNPPEAPEVAESAPEVALLPDQVQSAPPSMIRTGELYLHERLLLVADTARQEGSNAVRLYTTIIEIDPVTKHPRNKIINFIQSRDLHEYGQVIAWLDSMAGVLPHSDEAALELAAELEGKLNAARKEIAELKSRLDAIRGVL